MENTVTVLEQDESEEKEAEEEQVYIKETKRIIKQLESIIFKRNQNLEICLWRTFDSTIDILFIFTPKLSNKTKNSMSDHVTTIVNASTLLSSVSKVILSKFKRNETTVVEALVAVNCLTNTVQRMKFLLLEKDLKLAIIQNLYQLVKSLLFVFLANEKQQRSSSSKKRQSVKLITPPLTPDTMTSPISSFQQQEPLDQHEFDLSFYQGGMQDVTRVRTDKSGKIKSNHTNNSDTVGKRFIRSISTLKKNQASASEQEEIDHLQSPRQKIDVERTLLQSPKDLSAANVHKGSMRLFFTGGLNKKVNKNATSTTTTASHIKDIFDINNELDHSNQRNSVQTLKSPYARNIHIRTKSTQNELCGSDSGCFTTTTTTTSSSSPNIVHTTTSIQKEYAEPIFIKQKQIKPNRSESDLLQILKPSTSSSSAQWFNSKKKQLLKKSSFLDKDKEKEKEKLYNISTCDEDDEILRHAKEKGKEGSILHISEDGQDVLVMEMVSNKLQVLAGTLERLFMKLADETCQDLDYVDTYILSHLFFTDSFELLENLMARFHLEALPGEATYFKKWQRCIQVKVLNVISRWIKLQFQDFKKNPILITRLEAFLNGDVNRAGFTIEADMIKEALDRQSNQFSTSKHSLIIQISQSLVSFGNKNSSNNTITNAASTGNLGRRPSVTPSFLSFVSYSTPPESPTYSLNQHQYLQQQDTFLSFNSKDIAKYLTLADFYILKCITAQDYLAMYYPSQQQQKKKHDHINYIAMMTERANKLSKWVLMEISVHKLHSKQRRTIIRKMIEIAKACLNWNNFHTSMVITMGLTQLQEFKGGGSNGSSSSNGSGTHGGTEDSWQSSSLLPNRDILTFKSLLKYLNVCNNMGYYRNAFKKSAKAPCIPFFPIILKDLTFLMDGNATKKSDGLINFTKFRVLVQSIHTILNYTMENYYFASELDHFPFFPNTSCKASSSSSLSLPSSFSLLDQVASIMELQINQQQQQQYVTTTTV